MGTVVKRSVVSHQNVGTPTLETVLPLGTGSPPMVLATSVCCLQKEPHPEAVMIQLVGQHQLAGLGEAAQVELWSLVL